ncbi:HD family hydrolase, partial [Escherichia coli]|nr:HD family hydrolase [Escherichia coli]
MVRASFYQNSVRCSANNVENK